MKGHKARVNAVAVHPSGKLALSVGKDRTLRMWDLMRGTGCASTKIGKGMCVFPPFLDPESELNMKMRDVSQKAKWSDGQQMALCLSFNPDPQWTSTILYVFLFPVSFHGPHVLRSPTQAMNLLHTITHPSRLHDVKFSPRVSGEGEILLAGAEDKRASVYEVSSDPNAPPPRIIAELVGHERR